MSDELKPCEHGRNFCMDCHYPNGKFKKLPAMYDDLAAENQRLRAELTAIKAGQGEAVEWQFQARDGAWCRFISEQHKELTIRDGTWPIRALYVAPPTSANAVSVRRELLERVCADRSNGPSYAFKAIEELRALLAQSESKEVKS